MSLKEQAILTQDEPEGGEVAQAGIDHQHARWREG
jgi:hypothetical protein